ncbi:type I-C CRISPR-associated protein Cas8c/Csd1 [Lachnospiraceae bacterium 42-17]|jgi:CRISPR-associated protein Csd1
MSWTSQLYKTYERNIGKGQESDIGLTPVAHMNANAQFEITLDREGSFLSAEIIGKEDSATLIPVTEASAGRSSGIAPHALSDMLPYIAGDFSEYCENEKQRNNAEEKFEAYITKLKKWEESEEVHPKVKAIYSYVSRKIMISDLIKAGFIELTDEGIFEKKKISGQPYDKVIVRFRIVDEEQEDCTWKDVSLLESYMSYYLKGQQGRKDVCYYTGEETTISANHPKGIVASDYGAKLMSANDGQGYTYRGRFQNAEQSYALSYEASQKIHSALTWLVKKQGAFIGSQDKRTFICWNPEGKGTPNVFEEFGLGTEDNTEISYKKQLWKTFQGYQNQFEETDSIIVMGLDAATTGRLSVTYYHEQAALDFLERVYYWGETCNWQYIKFDEKKRPYYIIETPVLKRIVECAFGRERGNFIEADDKVLKEHTQRLVKCMIEKQPVPYDIVHALTIRASTPMAYTRGNRERVLSTACAIISKYYYDKNTERQGEKEKMKLDLENQDRSYLFGRLLAVCEKVERRAYDRGETRDPNAIRLQSAFVNHPMQTWKILEGLLNPYFQKLRPGSREYYRELISQIVTSFREDDAAVLNQELKETYLLGYYLQRAELNKKREEKEEE